MRNQLFGVLVTAAALAMTPGTASAGDAEAGKSVFNKRCKACHTIEDGKHRTGPSLFGIYGKKAGSTDFKRYKGLVGVDFTWDTATLDEYIKDPKAFVTTHTNNKRTAMTFKLKKEQDRADVIEYLKTVK